jgi:hypothetical protein
MGSAPYVHSLSPGVLLFVVAWDGERSLSKGPGSCARYPCGGWGYGEHSLCAVLLADSALRRSGFGWEALPITMSAHLGALLISRKG